jgi:hypothetical protein
LPFELLSTQAPCVSPVKKVPNFLNPGLGQMMVKKNVGTSKIGLWAGPKKWEFQIGLWVELVPEKRGVP